MSANPVDMRSFLDEMTTKFAGLPSTEALMADEDIKKFFPQKKDPYDMSLEELTTLLEIKEQEEKDALKQKEMRDIAKAIQRELAPRMIEIVKYKVEVEKKKFQEELERMRMEKEQLHSVLRDMLGPILTMIGEKGIEKDL